MFSHFSWGHAQVVDCESSMREMTFDFSSIGKLHRKPNPYPYITALQGRPQLRLHVLYIACHVWKLGNLLALIWFDFFILFFPIFFLFCLLFSIFHKLVPIFLVRSKMISYGIKDLLRVSNIFIRILSLLCTCKLFI